MLQLQGQPQAASPRAPHVLENLFPDDPFLPGVDSAPCLSHPTCCSQTLLVLPSQLSVVSPSSRARTLLRLDKVET